jgi:trans-2,3-dihydro-3-hydroxyanthranilate isomerase
MQAPYLIYDVFTDRAFQGNPLAIFPDAAFDDATMQRIARELNLSETVFLSRGQDAVAACLRIFTPGQEIPFAGHPTVGTAIALVEKLRWVEAGSFLVRERVGDVPISIDAGPPLVAWLTTPPVVLEATFGHDVAASLLGIGVDDVRADLPPQIAGAGSPMLFIGLRDEAAVDRAVLDQAALKAIAGLSTIVGIYIFAQTASGAYVRMFAPMSGIAEDPATGGATGPLYAYLAHHGSLERRETFVNEQGVAMGRRSVLRVRLSWSGERPERIEVGGQAVLIGEGKLHIP